MNDTVRLAVLGAGLIGKRHIGQRLHRLNFTAKTDGLFNGISIPIVSPSGGVWVIGGRTTKRGLVWLSLAATRQAGRSFP
jgi:hypothetical protein